jgi:hypothetical protein
VQALPLIGVLIFTFCTERTYASAPETVHLLAAAASLHEVH